MNVRKPIADITVDDLAGVSVEHAHAEVDREMQVRSRLYDKWLHDGKLSYVDAVDRYKRLLKALTVLQKVMDLEAAAADLEPEAQTIVKPSFDS
jgi:hypothetical protein